MSNTLVTCSIVAKESLAVLENMLSFAQNVNRDWEDEYKGNQSRGYSPGATINIKKPPRYQYRAGRVAVPQATVETTIPLTLSQGGADMFFTGFERTLSLQQMEQKIQAAMATIANEIDRQGLDLARLATANVIGTPGTLPNTQALAIAAITGVNQRLDEMGAPRKDMSRRTLIGNPAFNAAGIQGLAGLFNQSSQLDKQYSTGMIQTPFGLQFGMDQNVVLHTNGTAVVATNTVNGAGQTGSTITVAALNGTVTRGTKITFAGVFATNPQSRQSTGTLAQFTVTADAAAAATSISISPALVATGAFQNVTASPANAAVITIFGTASGSYNANVGYDRDAFTLAMVPMYSPPDGKGVIDVANQSYKGMNIRVIEYYDGANDVHNMRFDVLFGWAAPYPELATLYAT
jgi:hypothetical protein